MKNLKNKIIFFTIMILVSFLVLFTPQEAKSDIEEKIYEDQTENIHITVENDLAIDIAKTIAIIETKGNPNCSNAVGLSGEKGCHQFLPSTWVAYSKKVFGYEVEQTDKNAKIVIESMVNSWLDKGFTPRQIFLIWNQGNPGQCKAGINKFGVSYDSCAYADYGVVLLEKVINNLV